MFIIERNTGCNTKCCIDLREILEKKDKKFGARLQLLREIFKLTQVIAAKKVNVGYKSLQNHEGGRWPSQKNLQRYVDFYGCDKDWLMTGQGKPFPDDPKKTANALKMIKGNKSLTDAAPETPTNLDTQLLKTIIELIEKELKYRNLTLEPSLKAEAVVLLYELYLGTEKRVESNTVERYLKLVAA